MDNQGQKPDRTGWWVAAFLGVCLLFSLGDEFSGETAPAEPEAAATETLATDTAAVLAADEAAREAAAATLAVAEPLYAPAAPGLAVDLEAVTAAPQKGWYDPRYVRCVAGCDRVEARLAPEPALALAEAAIPLRAPAPPTLAYAEPPSVPASLPDVPQMLSAPAAIAVPSAAPPLAASTSTTLAEALAPPPAPRPVAFPCAENGSCYGDISAATGRAKTVSVGGYHRRDGTYVRGHYRSKPSR